MVGIVLAYHLRSVWALVWSGLAGTFASCVLSYAIHPYRPRLRFSAARARELHGFGRWVFVSGVLTLVIVQGDDAFLGKVLGAAALGLYQVAYRLSNAAATEIAHTVAAVAFPAYSAIQDDTARLRSALFRTLALTLLLVVPVAAVMAGLAPALVGVVFGPKWAGMAVPIQVLCAFSILRGYGASVSSALYATGNPREQAKTALLNALVLVACIYPLTAAWGIPGTCVAVLAAILPAKVYASWRLAGVVQAAPADFARALAAPLLAGGVAFMAGHLYVAASAPSLPGLILGGIVAGLAYAAALGALRLCGVPLPVEVARPAVLRAWATGRA